MSREEQWRCVLCGSPVEARKVRFARGMRSERHDFAAFSPCPESRVYVVSAPAQTPSPPTPVEETP